MPLKHYTRQVRKTKEHSPQSRYSDTQKLEAVTTYLMLGKYTSTATALNIPLETIRIWKAQAWWKDYEQEIRRASNLEVSSKLKNIINRSADIVLDRLANGDIIFNTKTGTTMRKDVSAKTAADILAKGVDKDILLQKLDVAPAAAEEQIMDRLKQIQDTLRANVRTPKQLEIIEAHYITRADKENPDVEVINVPST